MTPQIMLYRSLTTHACTEKQWNDNERRKTDRLVDKPAPSLVFFLNKSHTGYSGVKGRISQANDFTNILVVIADVRQKQNIAAKHRPNSKIHQSAATSTRGTAEDDSSAENKRGTSNEGDTLQMQQRLRLKQNLKVELCSRELWRKFHALGTEMIITKAGRYAQQRIINRHRSQLSRLRNTFDPLRINYIEFSCLQENILKLGGNTFE